MKKLLALTLSILLVFCVIPLGAGAISVEQITSSSNAYEVLSAALAADKGKTAGSLTGLSGSDWSIGYLDTNGNYIDYYQSATAGDFKFQYRYGNYSTNTIAGVDAYLISWMSILPYDLSEETVALMPRYNWNDSVNYPTAITEKGIALTGKAALRFTAPQDGHIRISDPSGGKISAIASVNGTNTSCLDTAAKVANFSIKKNGETIWPADSDYYQFNLQGKTDVDFPVIDVEVLAGDDITFAFTQTDPNTNVFTMNPQIDYVGSVEVADSAYLCISEALKIDKTNQNASALANCEWQIVDTTVSGEEIFASDACQPTLPFEIKDYSTSGWPNKQPYADLCGYNNVNGAWGVLPYDLSADGIELTPKNNGATVAPKGVLLNSSHPYVALTYVAAKNSKLHLYDDTESDIAVIQMIGTANTCTQETVKVTITQNGESVWNNNDTAFSTVAFPNLELDVFEGDVIEILLEKSGGNDICVALNPVAEYVEENVDPLPENSNAHDVFKTAIANGTDAFIETNWSVKGGSTATELNALVPDSVGSFTIRRNTDVWNDFVPANSPDAYIYGAIGGGNYYQSIAAYEQDENFVLADTFGGNIPASGILLRQSDQWLNKSFALSYTAPAAGRIKLYDPTGAEITAVQTVNGTNTGTLDVGAVDGTYSKSGTIAVYQNNEELWSQSLNANNRHFAWPEELQNISVQAGDSINIVFSATGAPGLLIAMNPQVAYLEQEIGDLNDDGYINIVDLIHLKKEITSETYDLYGDLDGDGNLIASDLIVMRQYLLGFIDKFPCQKKILTSLKAANNKTYLVRNDDEALPFYGVYIRADQIALSNLETYFAKAAALNFTTVIVPIRWCEIEDQMDVFNFTKIDTIYSYLEKYDLDMQLLWYGSDNCGYYYDNVPAYVRNNTTDYPLFTRNGANALDYSNSLLVAREVCAITALMNHIAGIDSSNRLVAIQLENEANACVPGSGDSITSLTSAQDAEEMHFVGGQKAAILNLVNQLGLAVKNSDYSCVTRFGFASYSCYNKGSAAELNSPAEVLALEGIDAVGTNGFEPNTTMDTVFLRNNVGQSENLPHIAEAPSGYASTFKKVLNAFSLGGGMLLYQLNETGINGSNKVNALSIYDITSDFAERDGTQSFVWSVDKNTYYYAATDDWKAFNSMIKAVGGRIAETATAQTFKVIDAMDENGSDSITLGGKTFSYTATAKTADSYGTVGFIMKNTDGSYLLYSLKGGTTFTLPAGTAVTSGHYENGEWVAEGVIALTNNAFSVNSESAANGTVYRVTF